VASEQAQPLPTERAGGPEWQWPLSLDDTTAAEALLDQCEWVTPLWLAVWAAGGDTERTWEVAFGLIEQGRLRALTGNDRDEVDDDSLLVTVESVEDRGAPRVPVSLPGMPRAHR
jgi:hypothetical protein